MRPGSGLPARSSRRRTQYSSPSAPPVAAVARAVAVPGTVAAPAVPPGTLPLSQCSWAAAAAGTARRAARRPAQECTPGSPAATART
eukprot:188480-Chlamydomonas_euryale.AAC.1